MKSFPISIEAVAAVLPGAENLSDFWQCLLRGKSIARLVPPSRWDARFYIGEDFQSADRAVSGLGGFIEDEKFSESAPTRSHAFTPTEQ